MCFMKFNNVSLVLFIGLIFNASFCLSFDNTSCHAGWKITPIDFQSTYYDNQVNETNGYNFTNTQNNCENQNKYFEYQNRKTLDDWDKENLKKKSFERNKGLVSFCGAIAGGVASYLYATSNPKISTVAGMLFGCGIVLNVIQYNDIKETIAMNGIALALGGSVMNNFSNSRLLSAISGAYLSAYLSDSVYYSLFRKENYHRDRSDYFSKFFIGLGALNVVGLLKILKNPISN